METIITPNFTAKDKFNLATATPMKEMVDQTISVTDVLVVDRPDKDGVVITNGFMKDVEGNLYCSISPSVIQSLIPLAEILQDTNPCDVKVISKRSRAGRDYYLLELV